MKSTLNPLSSLTCKPSLALPIKVTIPTSANLLSTSLNVLNLKRYDQRICRLLPHHFLFFTVHPVRFFAYDALSVHLVVWSASPNHIPHMHDTVSRGGSSLGANTNGNGIHLVAFAQFIPSLSSSFSTCLKGGHSSLNGIHRNP